MAKPKRTFSADEGQYSKGTAGPDQLEYDLDNLTAMFDPNALLKDGSQGGIGVDNLKADTVVDQSLSPTSNTGRLDTLIGRIANRIKAILGGTAPDWKNDPAITLVATKAHVDDTTIHTRDIASVDGVSNPAGNVDLVAGVGIAITPDNVGKKITIDATGTAAPAAHASTHASNGSDPVSPASIGAETPAGAQSKVDTHAANASAHHTRYTDAEAVAAIKAADGAGSNLDSDLLDGYQSGNSANQIPISNGTVCTSLNSDKVDSCDAGTGPNNVLKLDASGKVPVGNLPAGVVFVFAGDAPYSGTYIYRSESSTDNDTWLTVGPTGSGAAVIWTALDSVPVGAKAVRLNVYVMTQNGSGSIGLYETLIAFRKGGSTVIPDWAVRAAADLNNLDAKNNNTVDVQLNANRNFEMKWVKQTGSNVANRIYIYLEGWYQ